MDNPKKKPQVKKVLKTSIKFKVQLNEEQKAAKAIILLNDIVILQGKAGSGKSLLAAQVALDLLFTKAVDKIIITRPTVTAGEDLGYMPGNIDAKLAPYTAAIYDNIIKLAGIEKLESLIKENQIEIIPLGFMRGRNFDGLVIVEEAQNIKDEQMEMLLTRLCIGAKMIMTGDVDQIDLRPKTASGFPFACEHLPALDGFSIVNLKANHRHPIVEKVLAIYKTKK